MQRPECVNEIATRLSRCESESERQTLLSALEVISSPPKLTTQEQLILELVAEGKTNQEIGSELCIAVQTVKNYVTSVLQKLGLSNRVQAAVMIAQQRREG